MENRLKLFVKLFLSDLGGGLGASPLFSEYVGDNERSPELRRGFSREAARLPDSSPKGCAS